MSKKKISLLIISLSLAILLAVTAYVYFGNSTVARAVGIEKDSVVAEIPFAGGVTVIHRNGEFLVADHLEKRTLGWERVTGNPPMLDGISEDEIYNVNAISWFSWNDQTLIWGFTPPDAAFGRVSFSLGNHTYTTEVTDYIWYVPVPAEVNGFTAEQLYLTLDSGETLSYPFTR